MSDLSLGSAVRLPELSPVLNPRPEWMFRLRGDVPSAASAGPWCHLPGPDGSRSLSIARRKREYILRFAGLADFAVSLRQRTIDCYSNRRTPLYTLRHLLLDHVIPLVLSTQRKLVLHASAVLGPEGVVAFMGPTGSGKSTLGLSLARHGCPVVADDALLVDEENGQWVAVPSYAGVRLWPAIVREFLGKGSQVRRRVAHYTAKERLGSHPAWRFHDTAAALHRVYVVAPQQARTERGAVRIVSLAPRAAMIALLRSSFQMGMTDPATVRAGFELSGRLAESIGVRHLQYPWSLSRLDEIRVALQNDAGL